MTQAAISGRSMALEVLMEVDRKQAFSNLALNAVLKREATHRREAGLATELVYGTLSRLNTLDWIANQLLKQPIHKLEPWLRSLLRMSLYQLHYLDRIPDHAIVHEAVEEAKKHGHKGMVGLVNGVLRSYLRLKPELTVPAQWPKFKKIALEHSHPEWLVKRWLSTFGEKDTIMMCEINNQPPPVSVRVNTLRASKEMVVDLLKEEQPEAFIEGSPLTDVGLLLSQAGNAATFQSFRKGLCSIQDESSMLVGLAVNPKRGMSVLDTCAAPGGKTTHLAERMENEGNILALDIHPHKLKLIQENAERLGISIIHTKQGDARDLPEALSEDLFDRILVDAPCSGFGVIRRKPDLKWQRQEKDILAITKMQKDILVQASRWLKPGGLLVYSTCTVDPEENARLVHHFLDENKDFSLDSTLMQDMPEVLHPYFHKSGGYIQILPHHFGSDGFFISRIKKKE